MDSNQRRGLLWAASAALCVGAFSVPWKVANAAGPPMVSTLVLLASAASFSTLLMFVQQRRWPRLRRFDFVAGGVLAVLTLSGNIASAYAIQFLSAPLMTVLQRTDVLVVALLAWPLLGERVQPRFWFGVAVAGIGLVVLQDPFGQLVPGLASDERAAGVLFALGSAVLFAGMALFTRRVIREIDPIVVNGLRLWISVGFWFALNGVPDALREAPARQIGFAALAGLVGPFFGRLSMMMSARYLEARVTVLFTLASPPVALVVAFVWLADWPTGREVAGGGLMLFGVALPLLWPAARAPADEPAA